MDNRYRQDYDYRPRGPPSYTESNPQVTPSYSDSIPRIPPSYTESIPQSFEKERDFDENRRTPKEPMMPYNFTIPHPTQAYTNSYIPHSQYTQPEEPNYGTNYNSYNSYFNKLPGYPPPMFPNMPRYNIMYHLSRCDKCIVALPKHYTAHCPTVTMASNVWPSICVYCRHHIPSHDPKFCPNAYVLAQYTANTSAHTDCFNKAKSFASATDDSLLGTIFLPEKSKKTYVPKVPARQPLPAISSFIRPKVGHENCSNVNCFETFFTTNNTQTISKKKMKLMIGLDDEKENKPVKTKKVAVAAVKRSKKALGGRKTCLCEKEHHVCETNVSRSQQINSKVANWLNNNSQAEFTQAINLNQTTASNFIPGRYVSKPTKGKAPLSVTQGHTQGQTYRGKHTEADKYPALQHEEGELSYERESQVGKNPKRPASYSKKIRAIVIAEVVPDEDVEAHLANIGQSTKPMATKDHFSEALPESFCEEVTPLYSPAPHSDCTDPEIVVNLPTKEDFTRGTQEHGDTTEPILGHVAPDALIPELVDSEACSLVALDVDTGVDSDTTTSLLNAVRNRYCSLLALDVDTYTDTTTPRLNSVEEEIYSPSLEAPMSPYSEHGQECTTKVKHMPSTRPSSRSSPYSTRSSSRSAE